MNSPTLQVGVKILAIYKGKFVIARRSDKVYSGMNGTMWDIPGGRIDPAFSLYENLTREIKEEVGLEIVSSQRRTSVDSSSHNGENVTLLDAQDIWVKAKNLHVIRLTYLGKVEGSIILSHEHDEYKLASYMEMLELFDKDNLIGQVLRAHRQIIESFMDQ